MSPEKHIFAWTHEYDLLTKYYLKFSRLNLRINSIRIWFSLFDVSRMKIDDLVNCSFRRKSAQIVPINLPIG